MTRSIDGMPFLPHRRAVLGGAACLAGAALAAPSAVRALSEAAPLRRGVNLSHWFAQSFRGYGRDHLAGYIAPSDLERIARAGFDHVRLPVDPGILLSQGGTELNGPVFEAVRAALALIDRLGLTTVLDLHPVGAGKVPLQTSEGARAFLTGWTTLATALSPSQTPGLVLEILNEPEPLKGEAWWALQAEALAAIRRAGWRGRVVANGGGWSGIDDLVAHKAYDDRAIVYTVHCYAPLLFTHQATTWSWDVARRIDGLGWPIPKDEAERAAAGATRDDEARGHVRSQIAAGAFTSAAMAAQFDRLAAWQKAEGGPAIYVGEFGVYEPKAPVEARLAWLRSVREACESRGFGWAMWDYSPSFGLLPPSGARVMAPDTLRALGIGAS
ncbi:cellulase family glycosylhydrolase [Methylobacterium sp. Leaf456]|uniref:glycoside hydrolase family 5 protein n=1 Tax=Methylobacterium sp. Leaf456 TaxID=1736382 RepID=UPI0009EB4152|nr:cellulase family glycosylhydrolase [Methylobacterium sp. Leaf456]